MEVERKKSKTVVHLDKKERFKAHLTAAPGHTVIRVDTITIDDESISIDGNLKGLFFGWSEERTGQLSFGGPEPYKELMPPDVYVAVDGLHKEIVQRAATVQE